MKVNKESQRRTRQTKPNTWSSIRSSKNKSPSKKRDDKNKCR